VIYPDPPSDDREPELNRSGETARTLVLIGLVFQMVEVIVLLVIGLFLLLHPMVYPILGAVVLLLGILGIVWLALVYFFSYLPTGAGLYEEAEAPTLVFALLSLLTGGIVSGVCYLVAYVKLRDARG